MANSNISASPRPSNSYTALLSRELQTPLRSILGYLDLLQDDGLLDNPTLLRQYLTVLRGRGLDLARIVSELVTFADLTAGGPAKTSSPTRTANLAELVGELAGGRLVRIEASTEAAAAAVNQERTHLILAQLLDHAFMLGAPGAPATVRAELSHDPVRLRLWVACRGDPMPEPLRSALFDPFGVSDPAAPAPAGGIGLGLAVARRAAEGIGGSLTLEPDPPISFRLELPLSEDPISRSLRALRQQASLADQQTLRAIMDLRALRERSVQDRLARELAEAQQLRAVQDFREAHQQAVQLTERLDRGYLDTITALARAVEARDLYTGGHVERVRGFSLLMSDALGLSDQARRHLEFGAILHDVGKLGVPDVVLIKPGPLDQDEWVLMRRHPEIGRRVLEGIAFLAPALDAVQHHHERWDGRGYPDGLMGEATPLAGRIVAVADAYDAMTSDRPYRRGRPREEALAEIERERGAQFDPDVAAAFLKNPPSPAHHSPAP